MNKKNILFTLLLPLVLSATVFAQEPKVISDCMVIYDVTIQDAKADPSIVKAMSGTSKALYIKGARSRSDLETANFKQIMIHDSKTDSTIILRELGNTKYISY